MKYGSVNIDQLTRWRLSFFRPLIDRAMRNGVRTRFEYVLSRMGERDIHYTFTFSPVDMNLIAQWKDEEGTNRKQTIRVFQQESNLNEEYKVLYFLCFGYRCRTLYSDGKGFYSRSSFPHHYYKQEQSRQQRAFFCGEEPYRKYGKETYRGELTPYGKRIERYERQEYNAYQGLNRFIERISRKAKR